MDRSVGLRFQVLGPLEVRVDNRVRPLSGVKPRLLLSALLVNVNSVVPVDRLIDILWGDTPPPDASSALAKYVYRLRSAFGAESGLLATKPPGYALFLAEEQVDALQFAASVRAAQRMLADAPAEARARLDQALALWHGTPWAEFADDDWVRPEVARLQTLRASALEDRCDAILALGDYPDLVAQSELVVAEFPLRERPRALLMQALYFSGRHADALSTYRGFRQYLADELGLEPSAYLRDLEHQVLTQTLERATRPPVRTATDTAAVAMAVGVLDGDQVVGRRSDLDWLEVLLNRARSGERPVIGLIGGAPGIGKTSLVKAFARLVRARGAAVVLAGCDPVLGAATVVLEALRTAGAASQAQGPDWDDELRRLDRALAAIDAPATLLVLDDLDAAPEAAGALLEHLAERRCAAALCVLGTGTNVTRYQIAATAHSRILTSLDIPATGDLLRLASGATRPAALVESVHRETGGVPSHIVAVGRNLRDADAAERADRALARAAAARKTLRIVHDDVASGVLARRSLRNRAEPSVHRRTDDGLAPDVCPYKGLAPFGRADAGYYCGRERLVAEVLANVAVDGFLGIVGASGSGKSSLAAAGLLPALAAGALAGSDQWANLLVRPGVDPIRALCRGLGKLAGEPARELQGRLDRDSAELLTIAGEITAGHGRLVLVVDQFEEVFAAGITAGARAGFIDALMQASAERDSPLAVAVVLRADYYGSCAEHEALARALTQSQVLVAAMTDAELHRAVVEPARRAGLHVEDGLAETICADAAGEPGALPLVSTALLETWVRRSNATLTVAGYADAGGVRGAVARLAEGVYDATDDAGRAVIRRVFLRLADPEGATDDVRRRAQRDEIVTTGAEQRVLTHLIDRRLVTATEDTVEVAHEALLREWPRLRSWLEEDREGRRLHRRLADAAAAWDAEGRDEAGLYRGVRLQAAHDWTATHPGDAHPLETEFLAASTATSERTLRVTRNSARRLRSLAGALTVLLIVAVIAGALAVSQRATARHQARVARAQALQADVSRLAILARTLPKDQRDLLLLLGAQGYRLQPSNESLGNLQAALVQTPPGLQRIIRSRSATLLPALDPTGHLLAVPGADGTVTITNVATGQVVRTLTYPRPLQFAAFSGDSTLLAAGSVDGTIVVWDVRTGQRSGAPLNVGSGIAWPRFDPTDNDRLYAATDTREVTSWDLHDPAHPRQIWSYVFGTECCDPSAITVSHDGRLLAVGDVYGGSVSVLDARTGKQLRVLLGAPGVFGSDGVTLPIASGHRITLYNAVTGGAEKTLNALGSPLLPCLRGDGRRLAVAQNAGDVAVYDVRSGTIIGPPLKLHANGAFPIGFLPDGRLVTSGTQEAGIWTVGQTLPPIARALPAPGDYDFPVFMPGDREIVTRGRNHGLLLRHDVVTGAVRGRLLGGRIGPDTGQDWWNWHFAASPDGTLIAAPAKDLNGIAIWRSSTGERLGTLTGVPGDANLAWSPSALVAAKSGTTVWLWNVTDAAHPVRTAVVTNVRGQPNGFLMFNSAGTLLEIDGPADDGVTMVDVKTRRILWSKILYDAPYQATFSPDGKTLAVDAAEDSGTGSVTLYDARTGRARPSLATQTDGGIGYLHEGQWLIATGGVNQPGAQLYDTRTLQPIGIPFPITHVDGDPGEGYGFPVTVNERGTLFAAGESDAPALWDVDPNHWEAVACTIAGRNLSRAEWHTYLPNLPYERTCPQWPAGN